MEEGEGTIIVRDVSNEPVEGSQFLYLRDLFDYYFANQEGYKLHPDDFKEFLKELAKFGRGDLDGHSAEVIKQVIEENRHNYERSFSFCIDILRALYWFTPNESIRSIVREFFSILERLINEEAALVSMSKDDRYRIIMPLVKVYGMYGVDMPQYVETVYNKQLRRLNDSVRIARRERRVQRRVKRRRKENEMGETPMHTEKTVRNHLEGVLGSYFFDKIGFNKIVGGYELDLLVNGILNVEIDGIYHTDEKVRAENIRDTYLIRQGIAVVRVHIEKAGRDFDDVLEELCDLVTCLVEMVLELNDIGRDYGFMSKMSGVKRLMIPVHEKYVTGEESLVRATFLPGWSDIYSLPGNRSAGTVKKRKKKKKKKKRKSR